MLYMPNESDGAGMYVDLCEEMQANGYNITIMAPDNTFSKTYLQTERGMRILRIKCRKTLGEKNMFKKGIGLAMMPYYYKRAYKKYIGTEKFDWIFMPTPPITLIDFVSYAKKMSEAKFYLILRDIHPQSAHSIGLIKYHFMYNYLEKRAKKGYELADRIGCMSQGNIDFISSNYPNLNSSKFVLLYNWVTPNFQSCELQVREKYGLNDKFVALFGGNIGLGQRIENIVFLAKHYLENDHIRFVVIGKGVEKERLMGIAKEESLTNIIFIDFMPQPDYLAFIQNVDLGLVSINENYKVPTCPSKAVSYMSLGIPIFAMINPNNDYGNFIEDSGAGYFVVGTNMDETIRKFDAIYKDAALRKRMSEKGRRFFEENLTTKKAYEMINSQII